MEKRWLRSYPNKVKSSISLPNISIIDFLIKAVKKRPSAPALFFDNQRWSYEELDKKVKKLANGLQSKGVIKGTRVALMMNNCPELMISYFAVLYCGGIVVQNNPMYQERELSYQLNDSGAEYLIIEHSLIEQFHNLNQVLSLKEIILSRTKESDNGCETVEGLIDQHNEEFQLPVINPEEDVAVLQYTGGTTGVSKGVMLTHFNLAANVIQTKEFLGIHCQEGKEKILNVLPLFHVYGMTVSMNFSIFLQSTLYLEEKFDSTKLLNLIEQEQITMFPGTPTIYVAINSHERISQFNLTSVHTCISGSAPLPVEVKNKFEGHTGATIVDAYGLSEASPVTHSNPVDGIRKPGSMGLPITNTDCKIVDIHDGEKEMPINSPGELLVKGPQIMRGYWNKEEETANTLKDGWLYTGDIAYMDEDGYCFIVSRKKDVIIASGYNIYPREVEEVIFEHPAVQEVVVAGIPDHYRGETVKAYIVLNPGYHSIKKDEIISYCRGRLAKFKIPTEIDFRDSLPKTAVGKILRRNLIEEDSNVKGGSAG